MRAVPAVLLVFAAFLVVGARAPLPVVDETNIGRAGFRVVDLPSGREAERIIPPMFAASGSFGMVDLHCRVANDNRLEDCVAVWEKPIDVGLDKAAIEAARLSRMEIKVDGKAFSGAGLYVSLGFAFDGGEPPRRIHAKLNRARLRPFEPLNHPLDTRERQTTAEPSS